MKNNKLVSVVIASYRNMEGIYESLDSIFSQTYSDIEIVISDDGSPEFVTEQKKIEEYIELHKGENIKNVIINAISLNGGTVKNLNSAIKLCNGVYLKDLSAEDRFTDEYSLEEYVSFLENSDKLIAFAKVRGVTPEGDFVYHLASCDDDFDTLKQLSPEEILNRLYGRNFLPGIAWISRKEMFDKYGLYDEDIRLIEDYPYWMHLARKQVSFGFIDKVLIDYRMSGISSGGSYSEMFMKDMFVLYDKYIFPYDKRYGILQKVYNFLKKQGLNFYMARARWEQYNALQKIGYSVLYFPFEVYVKIQEAAIKKANKR